MSLVSFPIEINASIYFDNECEIKRKKSTRNN